MWDGSDGKAVDSGLKGSGFKANKLGSAVVWWSRHQFGAREIRGLNSGLSSKKNNL